jgi:hypothetical protein
MEVTFTKEETLKLIEEYYRRLEDRDVKASATAKKGYTGWQDEEACVVTITISENVEIVGMQKEIKETIIEEVNQKLDEEFVCDEKQEEIVVEQDLPKNYDLPKTSRIVIKFQNDEKGNRIATRSR